MKTSMKRVWLLVFLFLPGLLLAQITERQVGDTTFIKTLIPENKQWVLKNVSMIANTRFAFRNEFTDGSYTGSRFTMEQFRMEFRGQVHRKLYFRFRNRFTKAQEPQSVD